MVDWNLLALAVFLMFVGYAWGRADAADLGPWRRRCTTLDGATVVQLHSYAQRKRAKELNNE